VVDAAAAILDETREPTPTSASSLVDATVRGVHRLVEQHPDVAAVGLGVAGMVDAAGTIHYGPNLPMLVDVPLASDLGARLTVPVVVDNDANVAAWGELRHGAARGVDAALLITLGTGVGGAIVIGGRVYRGAHGFAAELGHWQFDPLGPACACGEYGHWEAEASGTALGERARAWAGEGRAPGVLARANGSIDDVNGQHVGESARAGEADGLAILTEYAEVVAVGFAGLANILDPALIVVSGGLVELGDLLMEPLRAAFAAHVEGARHRPDVPIVPAELGDRAGVVGGAVLAREIVGLVAP
jgi:glucokinase